MDVIIGEQHIGDATDEERDTYAAALIEAIESEFPGLKVDYNPLSGVDYEWQTEKRPEVEEWVARNWESVLSATFA